MKYKLSKRGSIIIGIFAILLYATGMTLSNINELEFDTIGIVCESIALLYTSITTLLSAAIKPVDKVYVTPTFVDRTEAIQFCVSEIYNAVYERKNGGVIAIKYAPSGSIGKTEMLKKLVQVLRSNATAKEYLPFDQYRKCRKIHKKIGEVYFETFKEESDFSRVDDYPQTLNRYDIVIWDNLPTMDIVPISRKNLITIICRKANTDVGETAILTCISKSDMIKLYKSKGQQSMDDTLIERLREYSGGNMKVITDVLGSTKNIDNFKKFSDSVYAVKTAIDHGDYTQAQKLLESAKLEVSQALTDPANKLQLEILEADLLHYKNHYREAHEAFVAIAAKDIDEATRIDVYERQCHMQRHLGDFKTALTICEHLPKHIRLPRALGLNFMAYAQYEDETYREQAVNILDTMCPDLNIYISERRDSYHTYLAVKEAYEHNFIVAHQSIDVAIKLYESLKSKFLTNCYFIKAEIYRHSGRHSEACQYYQKCLNIYEFNGDFDIYTLVYTMITYENLAHDARYKCKLDIKSDELIRRAQDLNMGYNHKLATMIQAYCCSDTSESTKTEIGKYFEKYIFIIP